MTDYQQGFLHCFLVTMYLIILFYQVKKLSMNPKEFNEYVEREASKKPATKPKKTKIDRKIKPDLNKLKKI